MSEYPPLADHAADDPAGGRAGGDLGEAVNYGWTCLGAIDDVTLWGTVSVDLDDLVAYLKARAEHFLPPATRYEVRKRFPTFYGRSFGMAWYRNASMDAAAEWGAQPEAPTWMAETGHYLVGEFVTPDKS